ncbi:hypothetical protein AX15_001268 [Amanita polypyramis BW_CC]|nr:hypothetical protein AX15_001268 [Amanita polypyramis BW_CC]
MMSQVASYPLALLKLMDEGDGSTGQPSLGIAKRYGVESSAYNVPAHKMLQALITYAPSPQTIAKEFLFELRKCENVLAVTLAEEVYNEVSTLPANEWAGMVLQELQEFDGDLSKVMQLGSHYLSHLVIVCMWIFCCKVVSLYCYATFLSSKSQWKTDTSRWDSPYSESWVH